MNKKKKLLLSAASMLLLTATAATASTFAWFTTVRKATVDFSSATVVTSGGNLEVTFVSSLNTGLSEPVTNTTDNLSLEGAKNITDISGDGVRFFQPQNWNTNPEILEAASIKEIHTDTSGDANGFYIDFTITIARTSTAGMKVYFGPTTQITPADNTLSGPNNQAVAAARLAVIDTATETTKFIWAPHAHTLDTDYSYLSRGITIAEAAAAPAADPEADPPVLATLATTAYGVDGFKLNDVTGAGDTDLLLAGALPPEVLTIAAATAATNIPCVADLSGLTTSANVTFRAWIEGTEVANDALAGIFNITLSLYGILTE